MATQTASSRLSILYFNKAYLYTEDYTVIEQDEDDISFKNDLTIKDLQPSDVYFQERYNLKIENTHLNLKFTFSNSENELEYKGDNILKPLFLENGFNQYMYNEGSKRFDNEQDFVSSIKKLLSKNNIVSSAFETLYFNLDNNPLYYDTIELTIMDDKLVLQVTYPQHSFEQQKTIDLNDFTDTGMFFSVKENNLDTNVQGVTYKRSDNKFQRTNFYISPFENDLTKLDLFRLDYKQEGIHPEIKIETQISNDLKTYNPFANDCERYLLFDIPKQVFVNKFDNEIKFDDENWKLVDISEEKIDLEIPDYQIDSYDNAYYLFKKENFDSKHTKDSSTFKFNLHNRYIDSAVPNEKGYSSFDFEYFAFDQCSDTTRDFIKTPFTQKSHLGGYFVKKFANPLTTAQGTYTNLLKHGIETVEIPYPNTNNFYKIQLGTWIVVVLSICYILKKALSTKKVSKPQQESKKAN